MISKELKKLGRRELVDIIYQLKKNEQEMQDEIASLKSELQDKRMRISEAGSIANAAISITNVFETAQMSADIYLREVIHMKEDTEKECAKKMEDAEEKVNRILADGEKKYAKIKALCKNEYIKWKQLQAEIVALEQKKNDELCEDIEND